jgi:glycosyltransferase involved in cell wall biosynthesis
MRILVLQETDWVNRNPIMHHRMLEGLAQAGADVTVIDYEILWAQKGLWPLWQEARVIHDCHKFFADAPITIRRPGMLRLPGLSRLTWLAGNWRALRAYFAEGRPDVIVAYGISNAYLAQRFARQQGVPFVYHLMDALHTLAESKVQQPIARAVEQAVLRRADHVITINNRLGKYALEMGAPAARVSVIPIGVNRTPALLETEIAEVRTSLGLGEQDFVLLFMGWLYNFSGLRELTLELAAHKDEWPHLKLLVVGDGDLFAELQRLRQMHGLEERLILTGRRPMHEMRGYIAAADVCLLPAQRNATMEHIVPAKVIEYMEAGRPVLATRLPGLEAEFGNLPGLLYIERPEEALHRLTDLLKQEAPRAAARRLGATCRSLLEQWEDWDGVIRRFEQVLRTTHPQ